MYRVLPPATKRLFCGERTAGGAGGRCRWGRGRRGVSQRPVGSFCAFPGVYCSRTKGNRWAVHMPVQWWAEQLKGKLPATSSPAPVAWMRMGVSPLSGTWRWKAQVLSWLPAPEAHLLDCPHVGGSGAHAGLTACLPPNT